MRFTLDSVAHFEQILKDIYKGYKVETTPILIHNLNDISIAKDNIYYFGVLTFGNNCLSNDIYFDQNKIINVGSDAQIIEGFSNVVITANALPVEIPQGHFRGFIISIY